VYEGAAKQAIHRLKFAGWRDVAGALAGAIATIPAPAIDVITWVPLARQRRAERGFDQARAIAVTLAHHLDAPAMRLLRRPVGTGPQARRSREERRSAMQGAFVAPRAVPAHVLLVDDVLTTGATMVAAAEALRAAGAREVHGRAVARSIRALHPPARSAYPQVGSRSGLWLPGETPR
jgi:predicted amidophosphoribosyltransferase